MGSRDRATSERKVTGSFSLLASVYGLMIVCTVVFAYDEVVNEEVLDSVLYCFILFQIDFCVFVSIGYMCFSCLF